MSLLFFKNTCDCNVNLISPFRIFGVGNNNAFLAIAIGLVAVGIKFIIKWYKQQKQNLELTNLKAKVDLQILKTRIQPDFLFGSLMSLHERIQSEFLGSTTMILKFSEILSYILYDCDQEFISLEKELEVLKEYIILERMKFGRKSSINLSQTGNPEKKLIVPSLILLLHQDYFNFLHNNNILVTITDITIEIEKNNLRLLITFHHLKQNIQQISLNDIIIDTRKRLDLFYEDNYQLQLIQKKSCDIIEVRIFLMADNEIIRPAAHILKSDLYETI